MLYKQHGNKGKNHEQRAEAEEGVAHTEQVIKQSRKYGSYDLRGHRSGGGIYKRAWIIQNIKNG